MKHRVVDPAGAIFGLLVPLLCAASGFVLTTLWEPRLPEKIATHWTTTSPDGFSSPTASAWTAALLTLLFGGGLSAIAALAPAMLMMRRFMLVIGLCVVGLITAAQVAILASQLDVTDSASVPAPLGPLAIGTAIGGGIGLLGARLLRDYRPRTAATGIPNPDLPRGDVPLPVADDVGFTAKGSVIFALIFAAPGVILGLVYSIWFLALFVLLALFSVTLVRFRVVVDDSSIRVFNMGMAAMTYGVDEVVEAKVAEIKPFADFGGWGLKSRGRRNYGIVTRTGPAVVIAFAGGDRLTITTPKASDMAGALNHLADQRAESA